jgi:hypothetical protein
MAVWFSFSPIGSPSIICLHGSIRAAPGQIIETGSSSYRIVHARNARPASYGPRGTPDVYRDTAEVVGPAPRPHCLCDHGR